MIEIGKALVFYNLYFDEMQRLLDDKKAFPKINERSDRKKIWKSVDAIDRAAGREGRVLLEACMAEVRHRLESAKVAKIVPATRMGTMEKRWEVAFHVMRPTQKKSDKKTRQIGMTLFGTSELTPWVWSPRGASDEAEIAGLFAKGVRWFDSREGDWANGTVHLAPIPVRWKSAKAFSLDREPVVKKAQAACKAISVAFIRKLIAMP